MGGGMRVFYLHVTYQATVMFAARWFKRVLSDMGVHFFVGPHETLQHLESYSTGCLSRFLKALSSLENTHIRCDMVKRRLNLMK